MRSLLFSRGSGSNTALVVPSLRRLHEAAASFTLRAQQGAATVAGGGSHRRLWRYPTCHDVRRKESVVVIMGATGAGKSKLSIEVATRFPSEVVNADKIQLYRGLDITTNKIPVPDRRGVPHHLLGALDPAAGELPPAAFRALAASVISAIASRRRLPVVAGGSNSLLHALVADCYDPKSGPFAAAAMDVVEQYRFRYRCCFLWVDVEAATLGEQLDRRVEEMVGAGMVEELEAYFAEEGDGVVERHPGLGKAIGVPEFRGYFGKGRRGSTAEYEEAVATIKENTRRLAEAQVRKIKRLGELGWDIRRLDATEAVRASLRGEGAAAEGWEREVLAPSMEAVHDFLEEEEEEGEEGRQLLPLALRS